MEQLENAISNLVNAIPRDIYFDTHHIIRLLIKRHSDVYNQYANPTLPKHGNIGKILKTLENQIRYVGQSLSTNIHDNVSECALWRKL